MLAVDTHILVYASRADLHFHSSSAAALESLVSSRRPWAIPWPCAHEFIATVTNRRIFGDPTPLDRAIDQLSAWREAGAIWLGEGVDHLGVLHRVAIAGHAEGPRIHDARIAAICLANRVSELWSADRDFTRFPELTVRNPLVG